MFIGSISASLVLIASLLIISCSKETAERPNNELKACTPTTIVPYIQVNGGSWQQTSSVTVSSGTTVKFGPQPTSGGSWSWSGCGASGTAREQTVHPTSTCTSTATYTNSCGAKSTQNFVVTVSGGGGGPTATINLSSVQQSIDGFGAATVWNGQLTDAEANAAFNTGSGQMGLSICRVRFDPGGNDVDEKSNASKAKSRGAKILASVWSPPASMKSNNSTIGGSLNSSSYAAYATWLSNERSSFGNIDVVSIQNEPNISVSYESCSWTAAQLQTFCQNNAQNIGGSVMMPEAYNFDISYSDPTLNNSTSASHISYIGGHLYGGSPFTYTNALNKGKKVWMTEHYLNPDDIGTCLTMAKEINDCMTNNMSAYVWWYVKQPDCNLMNAGGSLKKKGYTISQYARFVRPGYQRVDATYNPTGSVYVSAYKGSKIVVVAVNQGGSSVNLTFTYQNGTVTSVTKYTTSGSKNANNDGSINVTGGSFSTTLDAQSITSFVQN